MTRKIAGNQELAGLLDRVATEYNEYRSPEATARVRRVTAAAFDVEFTCPFCRSCGAYDYFDDFKVYLEDSGVSARIAQVRPVARGAVVTFAVIKSPA